MTALGTIATRTIRVRQRNAVVVLAAITPLAVAACEGDSGTASTTLPESGPVTLRSPYYRYALTIDVERLKGRFDDVFFVGLPWTGDLASFAQMFVDHAAERNSCSVLAGLSWA